MFNLQALLESLPIMAKGMAGIFIVIIVIMLSLKLMTVFFPEEKEKDEK